MCGSGVIRLVPFLRLSIGVRHANVLTPAIFIAQEPQTPSRQDRRNDNVGSIWSLILTNASRTIGPQWSRSMSKMSSVGLAFFAGSHRYIRKLLTSLAGCASAHCLPSPHLEV